MPFVTEPTYPSETEVSQQTLSSTKEKYSLSLSEHTRNQIAVLLESPNAQLSPDLAFLPSSCVLSLPRLDSASSAGSST
ncbi:Hydroxypyruvate reductase [Fusarium oxysporum f. sp. albedinis]|nr:Hydroxypyruvate reductase [Fusarium oxysporum f. sp. albedinis]